MLVLLERVNEAQRLAAREMREMQTNDSSSRGGRGGGGKGKRGGGGSVGGGYEGGDGEEGESVVKDVMQSARSHSSIQSSGGGKRKR